MFVLRLCLSALWCGLALCPAIAFAEGGRVVDLRCEFAVGPLGVDTPTPRLSWRLESDRRGAKQTAYEVEAMQSAKPGSDAGDVWTQGKVDGATASLIMQPFVPLRSSQSVWWRVRAWDEEGEPTAWSEPAEFTMGVLEPDDWSAEWIVAPWQTESVLMRKGFAVKPGLKRAIAHVCGLGQFEMSLNGRKSGDGLLAPGWTKYNRTCLYETHDITSLLSDGDNAVGLILGDGMHHTERRNRFSKFQGTFGPQRAIVQIELEYEDGTTERVVSDPTWRVDPGPITFNDIFGGEDYDARRLPADWDEAGFDDSAWGHAVELVRPGGKLRGMTASAPSIAAIETLPAKEISRSSDSRSVLDFGQNASFMPRVTVRGPAGSTVRLTHAEVLDDEGQIDRGTCGGNRGPAYWQYTKATDGEETWFPKFFYAGCRYLQADLIPAGQGGALPELVSVDGVVVHTTAAPAGDFACSNDLLNRIRTLVRWAQRSNLVSVLTDCPHREKLGWLEQYHLNGPGVRYEFDAHRLFIKGMCDMADSQIASGLVPNIAPEYVEFPGTFRAASEWGSAVILVPWQHYQATGDTSLFADYYPTMQRYLEYLTSQATDSIVEEGLGDWYDLGPADRPGHAQLTPPPVTATAFYYESAKTLAQIAKLLDKPEDAAKHQELAETIRDAWRAKFRNDDGTYATGSQCSNAIALMMGLAEERDRDAALAALVKDVRDRGDAMTAGDVGFRYLLQALADGGHSDVIYDMINQSERPGYGYQLAHGATALTEAWDANHHASHNHFMLGHITEWFYKDLVGIESDPSAPGYEKIVIRPNPVGDLAWAEATHDTVRGPIHVRWDRKGDAFKLAVKIPANTTATVHVPAAKHQTITESAQPVAEATGVALLERDEERAIYRIESGAYEFAAE
ncbi:Bacterial alpha-L-rhamnosidase [Botrimarina colliarenosi]|uniref:alpha-L-rhamnosidase n=1 Tax=Botrimarina colliarenosi TaxID=2528001 RepID=A0A5C6ACM3_9BACT|nr:glycoside hydrolase family 78 protein [Botrimarina colliarenosi]TWT97704.1 Bacterial alpha-L-rhamnosidase [Botrimarina colliarenosi]